MPNRLLLRFFDAHHRYLRRTPAKTRRHRAIQRGTAARAHLAHSARATDTFQTERRPAVRCLDGAVVATGSRFPHAPLSQRRTLRRAKCSVLPPIPSRKKEKANQLRLTTFSPVRLPRTKTKRGTLDGYERPAWGCLTCLSPQETRGDRCHAASVRVIKTPQPRAARRA